MLEDIGNGKLPEWQHEELSKPHSSKTATRGENYKTQSFKNFMKILLRVHRKKNKKFKGKSTKSLYRQQESVALEQQPAFSLPSPQLSVMESPLKVNVDKKTRLPLPLSSKGYHMSTGRPGHQHSSPSSWSAL